MLPVIIIVSFVLLDQISKYFALIKLKPISSIELISGVLNFTFVENRGAAFGIMDGQRWFFIVMTLVVSVIIGYCYVKSLKNPNPQYKWVRLSFILILSGALGNFIDRLIRSYVVDFIHFTLIDWPVFNIADIYVVCGTFLLAFLLLFVIKEEKYE